MRWGCMAAEAFSFPEEEQAVPEQVDATDLETMVVLSIWVQLVSRRLGRLPLSVESYQ